MMEYRFKYPHFLCQSLDILYSISFYQRRIETAMCPWSFIYFAFPQQVTEGLCACCWAEGRQKTQTGSCICSHCWAICSEFTVRRVCHDVQHHNLPSGVSDSFQVWFQRHSIQRSIYVLGITCILIPVYSTL